MPRPVLFLASLFAAATLAQILHPGVVVAVPGAPWNWVVAVLPAAVAAIVARDGVVRAAIGSVPMALASLAILALACIPLAVWPTGTEAPPWLLRHGLGDPLHSLPFAVAMTAVQANLAACLVGRWRSPRFVLVHLGILLALVSGIAGSGTLQRGRLVLTIGGEPSARAQDEAGRPLDLPFALRLIDFRLDSYPPTLVVASADRQQVRGGEVLLGPGTAERIGDLVVTVGTWLPTAAVVAGVPRPYHERGAGPAALVSVTAADGSTCSGWLHAPTPFGGDLRLDLPDGRVVAMAPPRPRGFTSIVADAAGQRHEIAVNRPLVRDGWAISQLSYDERLGGASPVSVLEVVEDRALPGVYAGILLLVAGVLAHAGATIVRVVPRRQPGGAS